MNEVKPPRLAVKFLLLFLKPSLAEEVLGDLDEKFYWTLIIQGARTKAKWIYWFQVIHYLRPFAFKFLRSNSIFVTMIRHNFLISYRILLKNKMFSSINIGGLAFGMSLAILIGLWIYDELSFNQNHKHYDRIVQVLRKDMDDGLIEVNSSMVSKLGVYLDETYPTLFDNVSMTFYRNQEQFLKVGERSVERFGYFFSKDVNELLQLDFVAGSTFDESEKYVILLSQSLAKTLFVDENPVGKSLSINNSVDLFVSGVYKDLPQNSTFQDMEYIIPIELIYNEENPATWDNYNTKIYALLKEGVNITEAEEVIKDALSINISEEPGVADLLLIGMKDWHLNSNYQDGVLVTSSRMQIIRIYGLIGVFVLFLAFINFINLNTARCNTRMKEIGIRKSIGSYRKQLIQQFLSEAFLYAIASFILALVVVVIFLDAFNQLSGKEMAMPWQSAYFWISIVAFVFISAFVAGAYPAFFLSSFNPVKALKGGIKQGTLSTRFRQVLVLFQFTISIALIIGTITVYNQLAYAKSRPVGYNQSDLITMRGRSEQWDENYDLLREELKKTGSVIEMASANYPLNNDLGNNNGFTKATTSEPYN